MTTQEQANAKELQKDESSGTKAIQQPPDPSVQYCGGSLPSVKIQQSTDDHVFLIGRPPISEYLGFIRSMVLGGQSADQGQLAEEWRRANNHVLSLESSEAGVADAPGINQLPEVMESLAPMVLGNSLFQRTFAIVPAKIAIVELDRLVVYQKFINLQYVNSLKSWLDNDLTPEKIFRLALCLDRNHPPFQVMQTAPNTYTFVSPSNDFRFLDAELFGPGQAPGLCEKWPAGITLGLTFGYGSNYLNALHIENRLVLNNGSHRAYALRDLGVTHVPCVIQEISRREELEIVGSVEIRQNPDRFLKAPRPPLLKDYFDPLLRKVVPVTKKNRLVKISFGLEQSDIPTN